MHAPTGQVPLIAGTVQVLGRLVHERWDSFMHTVMIQVVYGERALIHWRDSKCLPRSVTFQVSRSTREYFYTRLIVVLFSSFNNYHRNYFLVGFNLCSSLRKWILLSEKLSHLYELIKISLVLYKMNKLNSHNILKLFLLKVNAY